jgi:ribosome-binding factor A
MARNTSAKGASQRQLRVGELIRHALSEILSRGDVHDPEIQGMIITVPEVQVAPDLKRATAFIMPLGGVGIDKALAVLERHRKFLRGEVARRISLRHSPELIFRVDTSFSEAERVDQLLRSPEMRRSLDSNDD